MGLLHTGRLREVVGSHLEDPLEFAEAWDAATEAKLTPWYRETVEEDRDRLREIEALRNGLEPAPPSERPAVLRTSAQHGRMLTIPTCSGRILDLSRRPEAARADVRRERRRRANARAGGREPAPAMPGPSREELVAMLG